jgi:hypothetical protein
MINQKNVGRIGNPTYTMRYKFPHKSNDYYPGKISPMVFVRFCNSPA